jgi:P pilus assembly chaperone PapD
MNSRYRIGFLLLSFLFSSQVCANVYEVSPTQLFLSAKEIVGVVKVTNHGNESSLLQLSLLDWQQHDGKDIYQVSHDILLTPPLFILPAHKTQVIRFALRHPIYNTLQKTYRLHIKEVQQPQKKRLGQTLYFLVDLSLGLFVQPQHIVEQFVWSAKRSDPRHIKLQLYNDGNVTLFIKKWQLLPAEQQGQRALATKENKTFAYILPRQTQSWVVAVDPNTTYTDIKSNINGQSKKSVLHRL